MNEVKGFVDGIDFTKLITERKLMEVKYQGQNLDGQYCLELLQLVVEQNNLILEKQGIKKQRRQAFKEKNDEKYKEIVFK